MKSIILQATTNVLVGLLLIFSAFLVLRGHNFPGGGFGGGLVAASSFSLVALAYGPSVARRMLRINPSTLIVLGLVVAVVSGLFGLFQGMPFLTGVWHLTPLPVIGKAGTPLLFDLGVYILVVGVTLSIIFNLADDLPEQ